MFKCEKGGIRRILMNLFGNSLKFTSVRYEAIGGEHEGLDYGADGLL